MSARQIQAQPERTRTPHSCALFGRETEPKDSGKTKTGSATLCPTEIVGNPAPAASHSRRRTERGFITREPSLTTDTRDFIPCPDSRPPTSPTASPKPISRILKPTFPIAKGISPIPTGISGIATLFFPISKRTSSIPTGISTLPMAIFAHPTDIFTLATLISPIPKVISNSKPPFATPRLPVVTSFFSLAPTGREGRGDGGAFIPHSALLVLHCLRPISDLRTAISK